MYEVIKIRKGLNIRLKGQAEKIFTKAAPAAYYGIRPTDFHGLVPKLAVSAGQEVRAGTALFYDKYRPEICFTSPVNGTVSAVNRGERRRILEVVIKRSGEELIHEKFEQADPVNLRRDEIIKNMLRSGLWPSIRQRPYDVIANPADIPKSVFISAFDTAPLAPDYDFVVKEQAKEFQTGIDAIAKLTHGKIHLNIDAEYPASPVFMGAKKVQLNKFKGPHPAGNPGVQIHHIDPINKGDIVWYLLPQDVIMIGKLFLYGIYDASKVVALSGSEVLKPRYFKLLNGASIKNIVENNTTGECPRYISGNVLTGTKIASDGFVGYYDSQITVIPEGYHHEFLGWAAPGFNKYSSTRAFWSWLTTSKKYRIDTNLNGGNRAFVMTGQYEKVLPMNIYPMQLLKAILIDDIDLMEKLGIYEVAPEDFALCEYVCTSKTEIQKIIRKGLDLMMKEMS